MLTERNLRLTWGKLLFHYLSRFLSTDAGAAVCEHAQEPLLGITFPSRGQILALNTVLSSSCACPLGKYQQTQLWGLSPFPCWAPGLNSWNVLLPASRCPSILFIFLYLALAQCLAHTAYRSHTGLPLTLVQ